MKTILAYLVLLFTVDALVLISPIDKFETIGLEEALISLFSHVEETESNLKSLLKLLQYPGFEFVRYFSRIPSQKYISMIGELLRYGFEENVINITRIERVQGCDEIQRWFLGLISDFRHSPPPVHLPNIYWDPSLWRFDERIYLLQHISRKQLNMIKSFDWCGTLLRNIAAFEDYRRLFYNDRWMLFEWRCIKKIQLTRPNFSFRVINYFADQNLRRHPAMKLRAAIIIRKSFRSPRSRELRDLVREKKIFHYDDPFYKWSRTDTSVEDYTIAFSNIYDTLLDAYDDWQTKKMSNIYFELIIDALLLHVPYDFIFRAIKGVFNYYDPDEVSPVYIRDMIDTVGLHRLLKDSREFGNRWKHHFEHESPVAKGPSRNMSPNDKVALWKYRFTGLSDDPEVELLSRMPWGDLYSVVASSVESDNMLNINMAFKFPDKLTPLPFYRSMLLGLDHLLSHALWIDNFKCASKTQLRFNCSRNVLPSRTDLQFLWIAFVSHVIYTGISPFTISMELFDHLLDGRGSEEEIAYHTCSSDKSIHMPTVRRILGPSVDLLKRLKILEFFSEYLLRK